MLSGELKFQSGLALRPARPNDAAFLQQLYQATRDDLRVLDADDEFIEGLIEMQQQAQVNGYGGMFPEAMYFVVEYQQERIGRIVLDFGHNEVRVVDIAFIPLARGRGYGSQVIQAVQTVAAKVMAPVALMVRTDHARVKQLYANLGFKVEEAQFPFERMVWYPPASGIIVGAK